MKTLYIASVEEAAGKTALCAGICQQLLDANKKVAFLKPVAITGESKPNGEVDPDTSFIAATLEIEGLPSLSLTHRDLPGAIGGAEDPLTKQVKQTYTKASAGKDVVILEGMSGLGKDDKLTQAALKIVSVVGARVIMVLRYSSSLPWAEVAAAKEKLGDSLIGIVVNGVPESIAGSVRETVPSQAQKVGVRVLGWVYNNSYNPHNSYIQWSNQLGWFQWLR